MIWFNHWMHTNALAKIEETDDGWRLSFYWKQYGSGTLQKETNTGLINYSKEWHRTERDCERILIKLDYIKSERQDY